MNVSPRDVLIRSYPTAQTIEASILSRRQQMDSLHRQFNKNAKKINSLQSKIDRLMEGLRNYQSQQSSNKNKISGKDKTIKGKALTFSFGHLSLEKKESAPNQGWLTPQEEASIKSQEIRLKIDHKIERSRKLLRANKNITQQLQQLDKIDKAAEDRKAK